VSSNLVALAARAIDLGHRIARRANMYVVRERFASHGKNVLFDPRDTFTYERIHVGDDVFIGPGAFFAATETTIRIGNKVMFGPRVTLLGGNHNSGSVGQYMFDVKEKRPDDDQPILIEDDTWIGACAIVLKGVTIGRGAIVGAGAVVTRSLPSYAIAVGNPARVVRLRFTEEEQARHEALLERSAAR